VAFTTLDELAARFHVEHARRYGYRMDDEPVELVSLRLLATQAVAKPTLRPDPTAGGRATDGGEKARRRVNLDGEWEEVAIVAGERLAPGATLAGPVVVEYPESTVVVRAGWRGTVDQVGSLELELS
jgi:N-methylhydantoinase A